MILSKQSFSRISFILSLIGIITVVSDFGYKKSQHIENLIDGFYFFVLGTGFVSALVRYFENRKQGNIRIKIFDILFSVFTIWLFYNYLFVGAPFRTDLLLENPIWIQFGVIVTFFKELSGKTLNLKKTIVNPAQIFILSFLTIILAGTLLLKLPNATTHGISFIDALFTSTSAVCVTGLAVLDTGKDFTLFGQIIIMFLIQIGGLGILTISSYFSYFFKEETTYENQLILSDMTSSGKIGEVFATLKSIVLITLFIEVFCAILIYFSLEPAKFNSEFEHIFFSVFHSVSAFCNAGFSTLSNSLYEAEFRYNYSFHLIIILLFVLGGLGFNIVENIVNYFKYKVRNIFFVRKVKNKPWVLNINSRINLITTGLITLVAVIVFYFLEYNNTLQEHSGYGKIVTALFGATTPRTAGFNSIDSAAMTMPAILVVMFLMWVGASPQSTGGGIKTSTIAIATLNLLSIAKGKTRIEIFRREISDISLRKAFATISLSLIAVGFGTLFLSRFENDKSLISLAFECFSAYGTVGMSLGITAKLSEASKLIIILLMFLGRISLLTLLIAIFRKVRHKNYRYPHEDILIN
jgi:trk system potassium uptake protein TrkH